MGHRAAPHANARTDSGASRDPVTANHHLLSLVIRWVHVVAMALLLGGAGLLWGLAVASRETDSTFVRVAERYEWLFWAAMGLLVVTGVGNLGAFGEALPSPESVWGGRLAVKLLAVLILFVLSLLRTFLIARLSALGNPSLSASGHRILRWAYAGAVLLAGAILALAVSWQLSL